MVGAVSKDFCISCLHWKGVYTDTLFVEYEGYFAEELEEEQDEMSQTRHVFSV